MITICTGCEPTIEIMAAAHLLQKDLPQLKVRFVNKILKLIYW